jgi:hypothetical protein
MNCETIQNRLLALPDPRRVPEELRGHLDECPGCRAVLVRAARLDALLPALPVPASSEAVKAAFLERVRAGEPVVRREPTPSRPESAQWKYVAGLAAAVLLALGAWALFHGRASSERPQFASRPQELLGQEVRHLTELAKADTTTKKIAIWADVAADLQAETRAVYLAAPEPEITTLARLFDKAVTDGIGRQADLLRNTHLEPAERQALLAAARKLETTRAGVSQLTDSAPPQAKAPLRRMADRADTVRKRLIDLAEGKGA